MIIFVRSNSHQENVTITPELNKTKRQSLKKVKMITTQQPITSCCYFHNRCTGEKPHRENSKGICCTFVIPLALKKTSFQHCNLYLESTGCVSSFSVFSFCCSLCLFYAASYSLMLRNYINNFIYLFIYLCLFL